MRSFLGESARCTGVPAAWFKRWAARRLGGGLRSCPSATPRSLPGPD